MYLQAQIKIVQFITVKKNLKIYNNNNVQGCHKVRKSGKTKNNDKIQEKMGVFEKKSGNLTRLKKKVRFCQFEFKKFIFFQSLQMIKN